MLKYVNYNYFCWNNHFMKKENIWITAGILFSIGLGYYACKRFLNENEDIFNDKVETVDTTAEVLSSFPNKDSKKEQRKAKS